MLEMIGILLTFLGIVLIFAGLISGRGEQEFWKESEVTETERYGDRRKKYRYDEFDESFEADGDYEDEKYRKIRKIKGRKVKGGGIIMIGPIPIIFGDSRYAFYLGILAIVLMILSFLFMFSLAH